MLLLNYQLLIIVIMITIILIILIINQITAMNDFMLSLLV